MAEDSAVGAMPTTPRRTAGAARRQADETGSGQGAQHRTSQVVLCADVVTASDDASGAADRETYSALFARCCAEYSGEQRQEEDAPLAALFSDAPDALRAALAFQQRLSAQDVSATARAQMGLHINVDELAEASGSPNPSAPARAIEVTRQIMELAVGGQILLTRPPFDVARQDVPHAPDGSPLEWLAHGAYLLKGIDEPIELFEVGVRGPSALRPPTESEQVLRVVAGAEEPTLGWRPAVGLHVPNRAGWQLERKLGEGGFGEVWLAQEEQTGEQHAFKFCFFAERLRALKREHTLFRLMKEVLGDRADIVHLYDVYLEEAPYFLEFEYTAAADLATWAADRGGLGTVPFETRLELVAQVADATHAANAIGILHKDLKPANVLIEEQPDGAVQPKLIDFGIGHLLERARLAGLGLTSSGFTTQDATLRSAQSSRTGTLLYMAPELLAGHPASIASEVYALGVILYQVAVADLTRPLAQGWEAEIVDPLLREDIAACIAGKPEDRLSSAAELAVRLRSRTERAADVQRRADSERAQRRRRQWMVLATTGMGLALLGGGIAVRENRRAAEQTALRTEAEVQRERADYARYVSTIQLADLRAQQGMRPLARDLLRDTPAHLRGWEWGYLVNRAWPEERAIDTTRGPERDADTSAAHLWSGASSTVVATLAGHEGQVHTVVLHADGTRLLSASLDGTARVWDVATRTPMIILRSDGAMYHAAVSHDGTRVVTVSGAKAQLWDTTTGTAVRAFSHDKEAFVRVWFSPDAARFATWALDGRVTVWDAATGEAMRTIPGITPMPDVQFSADNQRITLTRGAQGIRSWEVATGRELPAVSGPALPGGHARLMSPGATQVVTSNSSTGQVVLWAADSGEAQATMTVPGEGLVGLGTFSADGTCYATLSRDGALRLWDTQTGRELATVGRPSDAKAAGPLGFSGDGTRMAMAQQDWTITVLAPTPVRQTPRNVLRGHDALIARVRFSRDSSMIATGSYDHTAILWDATTRQQRVRLEGHRAPLSGTRISPDGTLIATTSWDGMVHVWDAATGRLRFAFESGLPSQRIAGGPLSPFVRDAAGFASPIAFSPDGAHVVMPQGPDGAVVIDTASGRERFTLPGHNSYVSFMTYSPDGTQILTNAYRSNLYKLWDAATGEPRQSLAARSRATCGAEFSPDSTRVLVPNPGAGTATLWDAATGAERFTLSGHQAPIWTAKFSPDGTRIVTASHDRTARVWDGDTGAWLATCAGHEQAVINAEFSPDGRRILTTANDNTAKVWDLDGRELLTLAEPEAGELFHAVWSPDGRSIVTAYESGTAVIWDALTWKDLATIGREDLPLDERIAQYRRP